MIEEVVYYENEHTSENVSSSEIKDIIVKKRKVEGFFEKITLQIGCKLFNDNTISYF